MHCSTPLLHYCALLSATLHKTTVQEVQPSSIIEYDPHVFFRSTSILFFATSHYFTLYPAFLYATFSARLSIIDSCNTLRHFALLFTLHSTPFCVQLSVSPQRQDVEAAGYSRTWQCTRSDRQGQRWNAPSAMALATSKIDSTWGRGAADGSPPRCRSQQRVQAGEARGDAASGSSRRGRRSPTCRSGTNTQPWRRSGPGRRQQSPAWR